MGTRVPSFETANTRLTSTPANEAGDCSTIAVGANFALPGA